MPTILRWIQTDGGPSIVVPYEMRNRWEGSDPNGSPTHYDRACEAARFVGVVPCEGFTALAITRGPVAWLAQPGGGVLVHWGYADSPDEVAGRLRAALAPGTDATPLKWSRTTLRLPVPTGKLIVFDAAYRARGLPPANRLLVTVEPGLQTIDESTFEPDEATFMTLYRFSPSRGGPDGK